MANSLSAAKRVRLNERRRLYNKSIRSKTRTLVKKCIAAIESGEAEQAALAYSAAASSLDRAANKGVIHPNKAARLKSRLARRMRKQLAN